MAKNKIQRIDQEIAKVREKIAEYQDKLKTLEAQKTEAENLEIVQMVRALDEVAGQKLHEVRDALLLGLAADPGAAERHALRWYGPWHGRCLRQLQRTGGYRP